MNQLLQPPSSINDLRTQAHLLLSGRLQALDLTQLLIYTITGAPASTLPYLTWQFDMTVPAPAMLDAGIPLTTIVQNALQYHQKLGTPALLLSILTAMGYGGSTLQEGQASWGGTSYPASQGWAVFRVNLSSTGALTPTQFQQVMAVINFFKPARSKLDALVTSVASFIDDETPTGTINNANAVFDLSQIPVPSNILQVYDNGLLLTQGVDYTLLGPIITFVTPPSTLDGGDIIRAFYRFGVLTGGCAQETPGGAVNGSNTAFTLSNSPYPALSLELYLNGMLMTQGVDYTLSGSSITMTVAPPTGTLLNAFYRFGTPPSSPLFSDAEVPGGTINGTNTAFTLAHAPVPPASLRLFKNGQFLQSGIDFTQFGDTITYTTAPLTGDKHQAFYRYTNSL